MEGKSTKIQPPIAILGRPSNEPEMTFEDFLDMMSVFSEEAPISLKSHYQSSCWKMYLYLNKDDKVKDGNKIEKNHFIFQKPQSTLF